MARFRVGRRWDNEEEVAARMSQLLKGEGDPSPESPPWQSHGETWQLDRGNDWFLTKVAEREYEFGYRYTTPERQVKIEALIPFLEEFIFHYQD